MEIIIHDLLKDNVLEVLQWLKKPLIMRRKKDSVKQLFIPENIQGTSKSKRLLSVNLTGPQI